MREKETSGSAKKQYSCVCCSVLQCVAVCCSVLQCVAVCCGALRSSTAAPPFNHTPIRKKRREREREQEREREKENERECVCMCERDRGALQGGEDSKDPLSCRSFSTKEPLNICHFCGK